jgi:hypothetical protein
VAQKCVEEAAHFASAPLACSAFVLSCSILIFLFPFAGPVSNNCPNKILLYRLLYRQANIYGSSDSCVLLLKIAGLSPQFLPSRHWFKSVLRSALQTSFLRRGLQDAHQVSVTMTSVAKVNFKSKNTLNQDGPKNSVF